MEEKKKKTLKEWWNEKTLPTREWIGKHPDVCLTLIGGICSLLGGALKIYAMKTEYQDNLYTVVDGEVYKVPAKGMKTANKVTTNEKGL